MTFLDLYQILIEAEARRDDESLPADVRFRSGLSVCMAEERMRREGLTRASLKKLAFE
ncbi:hypothetical protein B0G84_3293 [Paraburkholderia sp. BL8N3]|nr:hypothetical protein [Paraburkholderia sp. BL8N3]TCK37991.1 hypothetical protein B0G84_3293 [Paraburkholderia sp. BL8N3]